MILNRTDLTMTKLDVDYVRSCFPAFEQPLPQKTAMFENAGGSYVAGAVLDRYFHFYTANKVQPYGASEICRVAGEQMDLGRQTMADLLGVSSQSLTLGPSTTQNFNTLAVACSAIVDRGDSVIVTDQDHEANIGAWERLCQRREATLLTWPIDSQGELRIEDLEPLIDDSVKVICMTHSSNIVGTINPVERIIEIARQNGIRVILDGVSFAPHQWPDLPRLKPDAYCFSTYKTYATHLGVMYVAPEFAEQLDPQCHYFNVQYPEKRFDAAGPDHASIAALAGLGEYFSGSHLHHFGDSSEDLYNQTQRVSKLMHQHEAALCQFLLEGISDLPLTILGRNTMQGREANIAMRSQEHTSSALSSALADADIAAGHGNFYAKRLLEKAGIEDSEDGVLRISFSHYNTLAETERVVEALRRIHHA